MEKEMKELYIEGPAIHDDPESCVGSCEGSGEALTGAHAGRAMEPRKPQIPGADVVTACGRQHDPERERERGIDPARSKNPSMCGISMRENREIPCSPVADGAAGRGGKAKAVIHR
jgi:hypothetical protein